MAYVEIKKRAAVNQEFSFSILEQTNGRLRLTVFLASEFDLTKVNGFCVYFDDKAPAKFKLVASDNGFKINKESRRLTFSLPDGKLKSYAGNKMRQPTIIKKTSQYIEFKLNV